MISYLSKNVEGRLNRHFEMINKIQYVDLTLIQGCFSIMDITDENNVINIELDKIDGAKKYVYFCKKVFEILKNIEYDALFLNNYYTAIFFSKKVKVIYDAYELYYPGCGRSFTIRDYIFYFFEKKAIKSANNVIAANDERALVMVGKYKLKTIPTTITNISMAKKRKNNADKKNAIVYAGYLAKERNIEQLIDGVIRYNRKETKQIELHIYGRGSLENYITSMCRTHSEIKFLGAYMNDSIDDILCQYKFGYVSYPNSEINAMLCASGKLSSYILNDVVIIGNDNYSLAKEVNGKRIGKCDENVFEAIVDVTENYDEYYNNVVGYCQEASTISDYEKMIIEG